MTSNTSAWPVELTSIPELLRLRPQARVILDRYGLKGCGGPLGPEETLAFFARAHDVPLQALLEELRQADRPQPTPITNVQAAASPADTIYRPFFRAGIAVVLSLGAVWGAYLLLRIGLAGSFSAAGLHEVNAHGHAQIFGWVGLFVMGFAYQAFPRFKHTSLAHPRVAMATLAMMLVGIVGRSLTQPFGSEHIWAWWLAVGSSMLEVAAIGLFAWLIAITWRNSGKPLAFYDYYIASALGWFVVQAIYESIYLTATLAATGEGLLALVSTWQAPLRDAQVHGFALLMILGVSQRIFHHFYNLPQPSERLSRLLLPVLNLAILGEIVGLILMGLGNRRWAALWYLSAVVLALATVTLVKSWRIFSPAEDRDRSLKFLRTAYVWLFISLGMLVLLPVYQFGVLATLAPTSHAAEIGFSHAYYGAIRHAITVGFVSMMIVGVAAKVVPTLNGINSTRLSPLWGPFVLINLGCAVRVIGQTMTDFMQPAFPIAGVSGLLEVTGLALWGGHLWLIMAGRPRMRGAAVANTSSESTLPGGKIVASSLVGETLDRYPDLLPVFIARGFTMLGNPQLRRTIARVVTIERACRRMDIDVNEFVNELNQHVPCVASAPSLPLVSSISLLPNTASAQPSPSRRFTRCDTDAFGPH